MEANNLEFSAELANIATKLVAVMAGIKHPKRSEHNSFGNYDYSSRDDIFEQARLALAQHGVAWVPSMRRVGMTDTGSTTKGGSAEVRSHVRVEILYICKDSGEWVRQVWDGDSISHDDKGIQGASTQAVRFALTDMFMLMDGAEFGLYEHDGEAGNHEVHREEAPPTDPASAIADRLYDVGLSEDQVALFGQWLIAMEEVESFEDISEARLLSWFNRFDALSDKEIADKAMAAIESLETGQAA